MLLKAPIHCVIAESAYNEYWIRTHIPGPPLLTHGLLLSALYVRYGRTQSGSFLGKEGHASENCFKVKQTWAWMLAVLADWSWALYLPSLGFTFILCRVGLIISTSDSNIKENLSKSIYYNMWYKQYNNKTSNTFLFFFLTLPALVFNNVAPMQNSILLTLLNIYYLMNIALGSEVTEISKAGTVISNSPVGESHRQTNYCTPMW